MDDFKWIIIAIILIVVYACNQQKDAYNAKSLRIGKVQKDTVFLSSIISRYDIFPVDGDQLSLPYRAEKIVKFRNSYFILDRKVSKKVYHFDTKTLKMKAIGRKGKGPGEYIQPSAICVDSLNGELIVMARNQRKLIYYSLNDLSVRKEKTYHFSASRFIKHGRYYYFLHGRPGKRVIITYQDLSPKEKFIAHDVRDDFKAITSLYNIGDRTVYHTPYSPQLYTFRNGIKVTGNDITFKSGNFTDKQFNNLNEFKGNYKAFPAEVGKYKTNFLALDETMDLIYFIYLNDNKINSVLYDKKRGTTLNIPYNYFIDNLTFGKAVKVLGTDKNGYFLNYTNASNKMKNRMLNSSVTIHGTGFDIRNAKAFISHFKISVQKLNNFTLQP